MVQPTQEFDLAVGQPSAAVARLVEPPAGDVAERVGDEAFGRQPRGVEIAARQPRAPDVELARHARGHGAAIGVEDVRLDVGDGTADRDHRPGSAATAGPPGGVDGRLRRAVEVVQLHVQQREEAGREVRRHRLPAAADPAQRPAGRHQRVVDHYPQHGGRDFQDRHPFHHHPLEQPVRVVLLARLGQDHPRPGRQRWEDQRHRRVERVRQVVEDDVIGADRHVPIPPVDRVADRPVLDHHAFGPPRRA